MAHLDYAAGCLMVYVPSSRKYLFYPLTEEGYLELVRCDFSLAHHSLVPLTEGDDETIRSIAIPKELLL